MIIVKLQGGLGNQMFQYAAARGISKGDDVYLDDSFLKSMTTATATFTPREFELNIFTHLNVGKLSWLQTRLVNNKNIVSRLLKNIVMPGVTTITDGDDKFNTLSALTSHVYLDGYFQNEKYFSGLKAQLTKEFEFPISLNAQIAALANKIGPTPNSVSVHVRRGDYLKPDVQSFHGLLSESYYKAAVTYLDLQLSQPNYYIFSDDPDWCHNNFGVLAGRAQVVSDSKHPAWADMYLMSLCKHHIIANSSYSWWAAWLTEVADTIIVAPKKWFNNQRTNVVPDRWIRL